MKCPLAERERVVGKGRAQVIIELTKGFWLTLRRLFSAPITIQYPEEKRPSVPRARGLHRLERHENGLERCIGCGLCAAVCPAQCIYLEAAENTEEARYSPGERYCRIYEINEFRCIFCGYCEEVCPVDAIILGAQMEFSKGNPKDFIYNKERLLVPLKSKGELPASKDAGSRSSSGLVASPMS